MADVARMRVTWSGTPVVGPGVSTFYLAGAVTAGWPAAVKALFQSMYQYVPSGVVWTIPNDVDILDEASGEIVNANSPGGGGTVTANAGAAGYQPGVGIRIRWGTTAVVAGRRVKGTTFVCPTVSQEIPNGVLQAGTAAALTTAANTYFGTAGITTAIYSRPRPARTKNGVVIPARAGSIHPITSAQVPTAITWLRTRRT